MISFRTFAERDFDLGVPECGVCHRERDRWSSLRVMRRVTVNCRGKRVTEADEARGASTVSITDMQAKVGQEIGVSSWLKVDQEMIDRFADITSDHQFIHVDPERTKAETPYATTIAHGFLVLSLLSKMLYEAVPRVEGAAMGLNYGFDKIRFLNPVLCDARIRGRFNLAEIDERAPGELTFRYMVIVEIEGAHKPALAAEWSSRQYFGAKA